MCRTMYKIQLLTAISTNILHSTLDCLIHVISNGVQMPQITKYEFIKINVQINFTLKLFKKKVSSNHQLHLKNPKGQHHKSRPQILPNLKEKYNVK